MHATADATVTAHAGTATPSATPAAGAPAASAVRPRVLGRMLIDAGVIDEATLRVALDTQRETRERLGEALVRLGVDPIAVYRALALQLRLPFAAAPLRPSAEALEAVDHALALRHRVLPLALRGRRLDLAMADALDLAALDEIQFQTGRRAEPHVAVPLEVDAGIEAAYGGGRVREQLGRLDRARQLRSAARSSPRQQTEEESEELRALRRASEAAPIVAIVDLLLERAAALGASDLHLEPQPRGLRCRVRVDGYLQEMQLLPSHVAGAVVSRLKIMAGLDIATRRRPQDGRATIRVVGRAFAARVSTLPSVHGEKTVIRLLDPANAERGLDALGMSPGVRATLDRMLVRRQGAVLVTGPTGSGKTTTLYSALTSLDLERLNVVTLEDPVEYRIAGVTQVQVHQRAGLSFAAALRSVLRQDPDVIMVGEMRDRETVEVGMAAALTGHLVLSTLHTVDAPGAAARLLEMGAPPYLVAGGLVGVLAQRVVRRLCSECGGRPAATRASGASAGRGPHAVPEADDRPGSGACARCGGAGYRGRIGVFEVMPVDEDIMALILGGAGSAAIRRAALDAGMTPIAEDARAKVVAGLTSEEEVRPLLAAVA